jgi:hypothetical protein
MKKEEIDAIKKDAADKSTTGGLDEAIARHLGFAHSVAKAGGKVPGFLAGEVKAIRSEIRGGKTQAKTKQKAK